MHCWNLSSIIKFIILRLNVISMCHQVCKHVLRTVSLFQSTTTSRTFFLLTTWCQFIQWLHCIIYPPAMQAKASCTISCTCLYFYNDDNVVPYMLLTPNLLATSNDDVSMASTAKPSLPINLNRVL